MPPAADSWYGWPLDISAAPRQRHAAFAIG